MKIYVASSWRNERQPRVVELLRACGHEVYDFRNPDQVGDDRGRAGVGFSWDEIDPAWQSWTPAEYRQALHSPAARSGFLTDLDALDWCEALVMVQPCGRSSALELGYAAGAGKATFVLLAEGQEPELMLAVSTRLCLSVEELVDALASVRPVMPMTLAQYKAAVLEDWEDCKACTNDDDACLWHKGFNVGADWLAKAIRLLLDDEDVAAHVHGQAVLQELRRRQSDEAKP